MPLLPGHPLDGVESARCHVLCRHRADKSSIFPKVSPQAPRIHGLIFTDANAMQFHRRENDDGSIDSICLRCFLTAKPRPGLDLESAERDHSDHCTWIVTMDMLSEYPEPLSRESV